MSVSLMIMAGSLRKDSYNKRLAGFIKQIAEQNGAQVEWVDLTDLPMPLFNEDDEAANGIDPNALQLKSIMNRCDGFVICSPEYNGSYSGALKNAIDWASRQADGEGILESFKDKHAALFSTSPGAFGGLRGLSQLRLLLSGIGTHLLADQIAIPKAHEALTDDGFASEKRHASVERLVVKLITTIERLKD